MLIRYKKQDTITKQYSIFKFQYSINLVFVSWLLVFASNQRLEADLRDTVDGINDGINQEAHTQTDD